MNHRDARDLLSLTERFTSGTDRTPQLAAEIEGIVIECCQDEPWFDEVSEALALFVPGGEGYYLNEGALASELGLIIPILRDIVGDGESCCALDPPYEGDGGEQCG